MNTIQTLSPLFKSDFSQYKVLLYQNNKRNKLAGLITTLLPTKNDFFFINPEQIKCGINGRAFHSDYITKITNLAQKNIALVLYPSSSEKAPTEIWVFGAMQDATPLIKEGKALLLEDEDCIQKCRKALKLFETAYKLQKQQGGEVAELDEAITELKRDIVLLQVQVEASLYLSKKEDINQLNQFFQWHREKIDIFSFLSEHIKASKEKGLSNVEHLIAAWVYENEGDFILAAKCYLHLAEQQEKPIFCLEKCKSCVNQSLDPFAFLHLLEKLDRDWLARLSQDNPDLKQWLLQKDMIRKTFEESLEQLNQLSTQSKAPTCFICFNLEEPDIGKWLEHTLVPDLDRIGIEPIFCFRDLGPGKELNNFQGLIRGADQVIIICTPGLKQKCDERKKSPTGVAQEVRLAQERYNDPDKYETIFPIYLKGDRRSSCPSEFFEPILGTKLTFLDKSTESSVFSYYSSAFELFGRMRGIKRELARKVKGDFLHRANAILSGVINIEDIKTWRSKRISNNELVLKTLQERVSKKTTMINIPLPPPDFKGRTQELAELHELCLHSHRVAVTGLGGMGKTALVLQYVNTHLSSYHFIHFMPAGSLLLIRQGLLKLADDLHISSSGKNEERLERLKERLDRLEDKYLLIFDGVDSQEAFDAMESYLPERGNCLLITSCLKEQSRKFEVLELTPFSLKEAVKYLLIATGSTNEENALILSKKFGMLPLALVHAASYIRSSGISIERYIQTWDLCEVKLFEDSYLTLTKEEKTILTTWQISIDAICKMKDGPLAQEVLNLCAFLGPASIPYDLLQSWFTLGHSQKIISSFQHALAHLCNYSLLSSPGSDLYNVHVLVQKVTEHQMSSERRLRVFTGAMIILDRQIISFIEKDISTSDSVKLYICHSMALLKREDLTQAISMKEQCRFMNQLGAICQEIGSICDAEEINERCRIVGEKWLCSNPDANEARISVATTWNIIGTLYFDKGHYSQALVYYERAWYMYWITLGENDPDVAHCCNNLGAVYRAQGDYDWAIHYYEKALGICLAKLGENDPDVADCYSNLGAVSCAQEKYGLAIHYYKKALKIYLTKLGKDHPNVARCCGSLWILCRKQGEFDLAIYYRKKALKIRLAKLEKDHPNAVDCYDHLGTMYFAQHNYDRAIHYCEKALKIKLARLGDGHPNVADCYRKLGTVYQAQDNYDLAIDYYQKALKIYLVKFGKDHLDVANCYNNLGTVYFAQDCDYLAIEHYTKALKIYLAKLGANHPNVAMCYDILGVVYYTQGKYDLAIEHYTKALEICLAKLGEDHPNTCSVREKLNTARLEQAKQELPQNFQ